jgi:hypothetical protein
MAQIRRGYDMGVATGIRAEVFAPPRARLLAPLLVLLELLELLVLLSLE